LTFYTRQLIMRLASFRMSLSFFKKENVILISTRRHRLVVRTPGFHPGNRGSIPRGATMKNITTFVGVFFNLPRGNERVRVSKDLAYVGLPGTQGKPVIGKCVIPRGAPHIKCPHSVGILCVEQIEPNERERCPCTK
jgi:hypothetical protein